MSIDSLENVVSTNPEPWQYASSATVRALHISEVRRSFGDWLESLGNWKWFITRTLGRPVDMGYTLPGRGTARDCLRDLLIRTEARRCVCVFEMQERGVPHLHALIDTGRGVNAGLEQERDFTKWGIARWKKYDHEAGAKYYLGKYLTKDVTELYIMLDGPVTEKEVAGRKLDKYMC